MAYDITDDALPRLEVHSMKARGWRFDADAQEWRKYDDAGNLRSPNPNDHLAWFIADITSVAAEVEAHQQTQQQYATAGSTGTDPVTDAIIAPVVEALVEQTGAAPEYKTD